uniref:Uncharacterized protein n=1 Tax=Plectus sambesii TaxID=2011161 RepID=A0A914WHF3_9BILA
MPTQSRAPATADSLSVRSKAVLRYVARPFIGLRCQAGRVESCPLPNMMQLIRTKRILHTAVVVAHAMTAGERQWCERVCERESFRRVAAAAAARSPMHKELRAHGSQLVPLLVISIAFGRSSESWRRLHELLTVVFSTPKYQSAVYSQQTGREFSAFKYNYAMSGDGLTPVQY